jgi:hypothetical protein
VGSDVEVLIFFLGLKKRASTWNHWPSAFHPFASERKRYSIRLRYKHLQSIRQRYPIAPRGGRTSFFDGVASHDRQWSRPASIG